MPEPINTGSQETTPNKKIEVEDIFEHEDKNKVETPTPAVEVPNIDGEIGREVAPEKKFESEQKKEGEMDQSQPAPPPVQSASDNIATPEQKDIELTKIENILSDHLDELFLTMTPQEQMAFKKKGEETAKRVNELLKETKIQIKEILALIREWLKIIPGVNRFFIEQEAKIKTDRLLNLRERK